MTGYNDYLIVLSPSESVIKSVRKFKEMSFDQIGDFQGHHGKAQITIQPWPRKRPVWIEPLIPKLERAMQTLPPATLEISGFDYFDHPQRPSIYAKLHATPQTNIWFKILRRYFSTHEFQPHLTIARNIPQEHFQMLWPIFKDLKWHEPFKVEKLTILQRQTIAHDKSYSIFKEIPFNQKLNFNDFTNAKLRAQVMPTIKVSTRQINLF